MLGISMVEDEVKNEIGIMVINGELSLFLEDIKI